MNRLIITAPNQVLPQLSNSDYSQRRLLLWFLRLFLLLRLLFRSPRGNHTVHPGIGNSLAQVLGIMANDK